MLVKTLKDRVLTVAYTDGVKLVLPTLGLNHGL